MGKGEIARYEQFLLFPQCFQKVCFPGVSKGIVVWEWVNMIMKIHSTRDQTHNHHVSSLTHSPLSHPRRAPLAQPHSSVGSIQHLRTGGCWFDPRLGQYSLRGLMMVFATGFIPLSPLSVVSTMVMWESS